MVEADKAVSTYCSLAGRLDPSRPNFDLGRVLARASLPLGRFADPDLAVAAADWAIKMYALAVAQAGAQARDAEQGRYVAQAAAQSSLIHLGSGRLSAGVQSARIVAHIAQLPQESADILKDIAVVFEADGSLSGAVIEATMGMVRRAMSIGPYPDELQLTTLADALAASGEDHNGELSAALVRSFEDGALFVPSQRQPLDSLPDYARRLAEIAVKIMPSKPNEGIRIGLEAHYMFRAASERQAKAWQGWQYDCAAIWARLLVGCADTFERRGDVLMALDLSSYALGPLTYLASSLSGLTAASVTR